MLVSIVAAMLSAVLANSHFQRLVKQPPPTNVLAQFANKEFKSWTIPHRVYIQPERQRVEVAPMPHRKDR
jgi:hypothetical protein